VTVRRVGDRIEHENYGRERIKRFTVVFFAAIVADKKAGAGCDASAGASADAGLFCALQHRVHSVRQLRTVSVLNRCDSSRADAASVRRKSVYPKVLANGKIE
jgi:hypothetical protein